MTTAAATHKSAGKPKAHVAQYKKDALKVLIKQLEGAQIIAIINMDGMPSAQLARMKRDLRGKVDLVMVKKRLIRLAIQQLTGKIQGIEQLQDHLGGMPALMLTNDNPFAIYKTLKKAKSPAPAKAGQLSPKDITVPKGPTPFAPGPVLSELAQLGIKAGVVDGKVAVKEDCTVIKEGQPFTAPLASMLQRLGIEPMEIGLDLRVALEKGLIYNKKVLDIDEDKFMADLMQAASEAFNLSVEACITTADNIELLVGKGAREAHAIVLDSGFPASGAMEDLLAHVERIAMGVKAELPQE